MEKRNTNLILVGPGTCHRISLTGIRFPLNEIRALAQIGKGLGVGGMRLAPKKKSQVPQLIDALLSMKIGAGETLRSYANRYWELYNEISGGNEKVVASTFRLGLPEDSELRESLTKRPLVNMRQFIRCIEEYKMLEADWEQSKGKAPIALQYLKESWLGGFQPWVRRELRIQEPDTHTREINVVFKEAVHKILERIKNEPYFRWPSKMGGDPTKRNQNLYCTYHQDKVHTTEQCRIFKDHLE
ncbi:uncharacterized protein LOC126696266 [Quercus robur]|uniref:uncharacterized protein LOC126696266 n=1 Tax=Quercus robur TaxID=38942 RepID=UPI00216165A2|nr:uncharacterized protein LOC126696266 [Quercus robur]